MSNDGHETMKQPVTAEWAIEAWNAHDLDRVMPITLAKSNLSPLPIPRDW